MAKSNKTAKNRYQEVEKNIKVSDRIIEQVRDSILSGELKPGDKLASEKELLEQFKVSKSSMREALRALEVLGLVDVKKGIGGGTFVSKVTTNTTILSMMNFLHFHPITIEDITMVRYLIEPPVASEAAIRRTSEDIEKLKTIIKSLNSETSRKKGVKGYDFHTYLARIAGNPILTFQIDFIGNILESLKIKHGLEAEFFEQANKAHNIILECIIQQDPKATAVAISNDILKVGYYISEKTNSHHFNPNRLENNRFDCAVRGTHNASVISEEEFLHNQSSGYSKRVGTSNLYIVFDE